ncbi:hypothetical protein AVEN_222805-1 [Araneus ventricosus]|uniref:Uncharacterized protein n=1 Tax=Araneus ventricosus TaxID=182803 RepID=A0A4Y2WFB3_ARAVE|nr:hypothetical protein AVEN_222805-1 [Araneus ventricosus]
MFVVEERVYQNICFGYDPPIVLSSERECVEHLFGIDIASDRFVLIHHNVRESARTFVLDVRLHVCRQERELPEHLFWMRSYLCRQESAVEHCFR